MPRPSSLPSSDPPRQARPPSASADYNHGHCRSSTHRPVAAVRRCETTSAAVLNKINGHRSQRHAQARHYSFGRIGQGDRSAAPPCLTRGHDRNHDEATDNVALYKCNACVCSNITDLIPFIKQQIISEPRPHSRRLWVHGCLDAVGRKPARGGEAQACPQRTVENLRSIAGRRFLVLERGLPELV